MLIPISYPYAVFISDENAVEINLSVVNLARGSDIVRFTGEVASFFERCINGPYIIMDIILLFHAETETVTVTTYATQINFALEEDAAIFRLSYPCMNLAEKPDKWTEVGP